MKFGVGPLGCRRRPSDTTPFSEIYESEVGLAEAAERAGFDSAWVAEHHFVDDGYLPSSLTVAGAIATRTDAMEVGTDIAIAPFYEPIRLAEDAAAVSLLARNGGGRFTLGLGLGYRDVEYETFGIPREERVPRLLDVVETCRGAWSDGPFSLDGRVFSYPEVNVIPKPDSEIKLAIGAMSRPGVERAARVSDAYLIGPGFRFDQVEERIDWVNDTLEEEGRDADEFDVYLSQYAFVHEDGADAAWELIEDSYLYNRRRYLEFYTRSSDSPYDFDEDEFDERAAEFEDRWRSDILLGTPAEVTEELREHAELLDGELHVISQLHFPGLPYELAEEAIALFGDEVIPELEDI